MEKGNPFSETASKLTDGKSDPDWIVTRFRSKYDSVFNELEKVDSKVIAHGTSAYTMLPLSVVWKKSLIDLLFAAAKAELVKSKLPNSVLARVWSLSDVDKDGLLDIDEFALAMYLVDLKLDGNDLPQVLPNHLIPPSKRAVSC